MRLWLDAMVGIMRRDLILFLSYRAQFVSQILAPFFTLTVFFYISRVITSSTVESPGGYFGFVVIGLVIVQILTISIGVLPTTVRQELVSGTIERSLVSAHGPVNSIFGSMLFPLANALVSGTFMLFLAALIFDLPLQATAGLAIPVALLGTLAFMPFAILLVAAVMAFKQVSSASSFIVTAVAIVGGLYFPIALLPDWIEWASKVQPFTPSTDLLRNLLVGTPLEHPAGLEIFKLVAFALVLFPFAFYILRRAIRYGQRAGTIAEY
jgi:ABC-2 type transport system permease protein